MVLENMKNELRSEIGEYMLVKFPGIDVDANLDASFSALGLDSLGHVELSAVVEDVISTTVQPDIAFNYPTVNALINRALDIKSESEQLELETVNDAG